jgi:hypothetical protein
VDFDGFANEEFDGIAAVILSSVEGRAQRPISTMPQHQTKSAQTPVILSSVEGRAQRPISAMPQHKPKERKRLSS